VASINLLPMELRKDLPIEWSKLLPKLILLGLISFILIFSLGFFIAVYALNLRASNIEAELMDLQPKTKQAVELKKEANTITEQLTALKKLEEKQTSWNNLLWDINDCIPLDLWLVSFRVGPEQIITINGQSLEFNSIGLFLNQLEQSKFLRETQLLRAETVDIGDESVYSFEFQAKLDEGRGN
jgi:Tfp pilus assembly protein PilN